MYLRYLVGVQLAVQSLDSSPGNKALWVIDYDHFIFVIIFLWDENGDGFITVEEFKTFYEKESNTFNAR